MLLSKWQADEVAAYVNSCCGPKSLVAGDMTDHLCCLVEKEMDDGAEFDDAFQTARLTLTEKEIIRTDRDTKKLLTMNKKKILTMTAVALGLPVAYFIWVFCFWGLSNIFSGAHDVAWVAITKAVPVALAVFAFIASAITRKLPFKEQFIALLIGFFIILTLFDSAWIASTVNWMDALKGSLPWLIGFFSGYLAWRCRPLWGRIVIGVCVVAFAWYGQKPLRDGLYRLFYHTDPTTGQSDRLLGEPLVFTRLNGTTFTTDDFPGKYILICAVNYNHQGRWAREFESRIWSRCRQDERLEVVLAAYDPTGRWEDSEAIKKRIEKNPKWRDLYAPVQDAGLPYVECRDYPSIRKAFRLPGPRNVIVVRDGAIIYYGTTNPTGKEIQWLEQQGILSAESGVNQKEPSESKPASNAAK